MSPQATKTKSRSSVIAPKSSPYLEIYLASAFERMRLIKTGVKAATVKRLMHDLDVNQGRFLEALNLKTATINRKVARDELLAMDEGERVIGIAKLVGQVESMVAESGDADGFDAPGWLSHWLREPVPALAEVKPIDLLDTMEGQALVARALAQAQSGAYA